MYDFFLRVTAHAAFVIAVTKPVPYGYVSGVAKTLISQPSSASRVHAVIRSIPGSIASRSKHPFEH